MKEYNPGDGIVLQKIGIWARTWRRNRRANIEIQIGLRSGRTWASQGAEA